MCCASCIFCLFVWFLLWINFVKYGFFSHVCPLKSFYVSLLSNDWKEFSLNAWSQVFFWFQAFRLAEIFWVCEGISLNLGQKADKPTSAFPFCWCGISRLPRCQRTGLLGAFLCAYPLFFRNMSKFFRGLIPQSISSSSFPSKLFGQFMTCYNSSPQPKWQWLKHLSRNILHKCSWIKALAKGKLQSGEEEKLLCGSPGNH